MKDAHMSLSNSAGNLDVLLEDIRACKLCEDLPLGPNPILQGSESSKILICGQAPGRITHHKGIPFDDPSGKRLRQWLGIDRETFYDAKKLAIVPMGFCFPGTLLEALPNVELTIIIGQYAIDWHMGKDRKQRLTDRVLAWEDHWPERLITPHPSPRNLRWLKNNPWFEKNVIPVLQARVKTLLA